MSEDQSQKSHAGRWIISVLLAVVLYVGSATPVCLSFYSPKWDWLPDSWIEPVNAFYKPAEWVWEHRPLWEYRIEWQFYWGRMMDLGLGKKSPDSAPVDLFTH